MVIYKFKPNAEPEFTSDMWYDIFEGGYIIPDDFLVEREQIDKVKEAIQTLKEFTEQSITLGFIQVD